MLVKRRQNLGVTDRASYLDSKGAFYNGNESDNDDEVIMKVMNRSSYRRVFPIVAIK